MGAIRLMIVESSAAGRELLTNIFQADGAFQVVGTAGDGDEALRTLESTNPDIIAMGEQLPHGDGYATTKRIMESAPLPIVIVSSTHQTDETASSRRATEAGAVAAVGKPHAPGSARYPEEVARLVRTVKLMAEVKVVRRWKRRQIVEPAHPPARRPPSANYPQRGRKLQIVAIGASTGGPQALQELLLGLQAPFPVPIVVVQHIAQGFLPTLIGWLSGSTGHVVAAGGNRERIEAGRVYLAPDHVHMGINARGELILSEEPADNGLRPSVAHLFRTVANVYGARAAGVLLTGMGRDGAQELKMMRDRGATTFAQNAETSVVYGMPGEAMRLEAAQHDLPPDRIAVQLNTLILQHV